MFTSYRIYEVFISIETYEKEAALHDHFVREACGAEPALQDKQVLAMQRKREVQQSEWEQEVFQT